ncbi:MAG: hypothetical protein FJX76_02025 [Armatimonadetes bacterium]|nr:hypothetical protein [Armatimonadota bacterium]
MARRTEGGMDAPRFKRTHDDEALNFHQKLEALQREGFTLLPRIGGTQPMVFSEANGRMVAILIDADDRVWTYSEREGLVCEEPT